ncbi:MAG: Pyrimidine-specific ribonucleoside hydrolase RihA [Luteibacter sp.]|uniref:nucleoside hydrolase n=1 Tax=Luteibacter sp. TaxID=1886636 RepID=UPI001382EC61|nr:nucleoside hydrolase [Luteibacter sp.]KAF1003745.1 MAG: Pyrimidine-specific ribonucleoside hydrolase RihA [Luteibacter sp.]
MNRLPLLIDTDPGVDDALAILMAHAHTDVAALTVAAGNVGLGHTVRNARTLVDLIDATTPVFAGCPSPRVRAPEEDAAFVHGEDGFGDVGFPEPKHPAQAEHAALALIRLTQERPGELTLVALGPLTNLALAVRLDPALPERVKRLVIMGGAVTGHGNTGKIPAEFNIGFDPEAAKVVFEAFPMFDLVDWEATVRHAFPDATYDHWLKTGDKRAAFFGKIFATAQRFNAEHERTGFIAADALAMAVALDPDIVTRAETRHVAIELDGRLTRGATVVDWQQRLGGTPNARIVLDVDQDRFGAMIARALGVAE